MGVCLCVHIYQSVEEELRCVVAVVRHGDRTPKQKMKMTVRLAPAAEL